MRYQYEPQGNDEMLMKKKLDIVDNAHNFLKSFY